MITKIKQYSPDDFRITLYEDVPESSPRRYPDYYNDDIDSDLLWRPSARMKKEGWLECPMSPFDPGFDEWEFNKHEESVHNSMARTKRCISDLIRANRDYFDYFVTFTFSPEVVDRYDYNAVSKLMLKLTRRLRDYGIPYFFVPERHKDGAFHFHGLLGLGMSDFLTFSGHYTRKHQEIYNVSKILFPYGFTTVTKIVDRKRVGSYILKYITKELAQVSLGKKRYWHPRAIRGPKVYHARPSHAFLTFPLLFGSFKCNSLFLSFMIDGNEQILKECIDTDIGMW